MSLYHSSSQIFVKKTSPDPQIITMSNLSLIGSLLLVYACKDTALLKNVTFCCVNECCRWVISTPAS